MIIQVNQHYFHLIENYNDAFDQEMFEGRYSEILDRYPYVVGDIGFEQLRLKGFFEDKKKGADISRRFSAIQDYLLEYCNFGCPFFVLKRLTESEVVKLTQPETITDIVSNEPVIEAVQPETTVEAITEVSPEITQELQDDTVDTQNLIEPEEQVEVVETNNDLPHEEPMNNMKTLSDFLK